jgi:predicted deacetylase
VPAQRQGFALVCSDGDAEPCAVNATSEATVPRRLAAADKSAGSLTVSIHDVAPATRDAVVPMLTEFRDRGVAVCSLLVVPNYHRLGSSTDDAGFCDWLRELEADGHEVVIHGYFHDRAPRDVESFRDRVTTRVYTAGEGEFYDVGYDEALGFMVKARQEFERCGLHPTGFIAPAWLLSDEAERAAGVAGFDYTTRIASVLDLVTGEHFRSRSLVYSTRARWRRAASLGWNSALWRTVQRQPLVRVGVHPPDRKYAAVWRQILRFVEQLAGSRQAITYRDWIAAQRCHAVPVA